MECLANGYTPEQALAAGLLFGFSWAVHRQEDGPIGAFGFTTGGTIWSLWGPLTRQESRIVLQASRDWIPYLVRLSGRPTLINAVHSKNTLAMKWLEATGCVNFDFANPKKNADGSESYRFETFPLQPPAPSARRFPSDV
jgi:hypothetical protein